MRQYDLVCEVCRSRADVRKTDFARRHLCADCRREESLWLALEMGGSTAVLIIHGARHGK